MTMMWLAAIIYHLHLHTEKSYQTKVTVFLMLVILPVEKRKIKANTTFMLSVSRRSTGSSCLRETQKQNTVVKEEQIWKVFLNRQEEKSVSKLKTWLLRVLHEKENKVKMHWEHLLPVCRIWRPISIKHNINLSHNFLSHNTVYVQTHILQKTQECLSRSSTSLT